jgi:hypothetical protein
VSATSAAETTRVADGIAELLRVRHKLQPATRTTSWFARWTKSPASDGKRRRP